MTKPKEDWRHAYVRASVEDMKKAQQHRDGVRWACMAGVAAGTVIAMLLMLIG